MKTYRHITEGERRDIERWKKKGLSIRAISRKLHRSVSSVSEEIQTNSVDGAYTATKAQHKSVQRRKQSKIQCLKVAMNSDLKEYVTTHIADDQSPEGISGRLKNVETGIPYASTKAIYKFVRSPHGRSIERHLYSKAVKKRGGPKQKKRVTIDGRRMIDERPDTVDERLEFGHCEGDFIESGKDGTGSLLVLVERKTRYPFLAYLKDRDTRTVNETIASMLADINVLSLTLDNDLSFQKHEELSELVDGVVYFCHPQCPQEKGTTENRNKAIRRYVPKRCDISHYTDMIPEIERRLRTRFMKCLGYHTPQECFDTEVQKQKNPQYPGIMNLNYPIIS